MERLRITNIDKSALLHKDDVAIKKVLDKIPGFKAFMFNVICPLREKWIGIEYYGNGLHVTKDSLSELDEILSETCKNLGVDEKPELSMMWHYGISATTEGAKFPHITALSGAVDLLNSEEMLFLLGHEIGHQICGHKPYHTFLECLYMPIMNMVPGGKEWISLVRTRLLQWYRISDFTADRVGLLACQDINAAISTLMKMAGVPQKYYNSINVDSFIKQAKEFELMFNGIADSVVRFISLNADTHPWIVIRAAELYNWYKSGEYEKIINKYAYNNKS